MSARPVARAEHRRWLTNGVVALTISGLGLAVAGSMSLTTSAETTDALVLTAQAPRAVPVPLSNLTPGAPREPVPPAVAKAFVRRDQAAAAGTSRSQQLRAAIVKERAAQRSENLSKTAEDVQRSGRTKSSAARQAELRSTDRAIQAVAIRLAEQRRQRAEAARRAAERARAEAEAAAEANPPAESTAPRSSSSESSNSDSDSSNDSADSPESDSSSDDIPSGGGSSSPVPGAVIGSYFGQYGVWARYHTGLDFRAGQGTPIKAVKSGVVVFAGNSGNWAGNHVAIKHGDGKTTLSAHMSSMSVRSGQSVSAGEVIGAVGQTGRAFGAHLHFELYPPGVRFGDVYQAINPRPWLSSNGVSTN